MQEMTGIELAEAFFHEFGLPAIGKHFPDLAECVSAGLMGMGSEVLGADDEHSRDHGWGPRFHVFLSKADYAEKGKALEERLNALRPANFRGIVLAERRTWPIGVSTIDGFFRRLTGLPRPPRSAREWAAVREKDMCVAQTGRVFYDPTGVLRARHQAFRDAYYPRDIWLWRIAAQLYWIWHYGDYNLCGRLARRGEGIGALIGQGYVVEAAMRVTFLLNRRFAPYWKWLHWAFVQLPYLALELEPVLRQLETASDLDDRARAIGRIAPLVRTALCEKGILPDDAWRNFMGSLDIIDHVVEDAEVRAMAEDLWQRDGHL